MEGYGHILAAVDFSASAEAVLRRALDESSRHAARLTLLHVIEYYPEDTPAGPVPPENLDPIEVYRAGARDRLDELAARTAAWSAEAAVLTDAGAAYHGIIRFTRDTDVDLIVLGYTGRWATEALGSTALALVRHLVRDVLLVRDPGSG